MRRRGNGAIGTDVDIGSRPVETVQRAEVTRATEVSIPRAQAFWTVAPWIGAYISTAFLVPIVGANIFWGATACVAIAAFLFAIQYDLDWLNQISLPFLGGLIGVCLWRFYNLIGLRLYIIVVFSSAVALFWWLFGAASSLTFLQRLGMPNFHQQHSIWKAIGSIIEWRYKREPEEASEELPARKVSFEVIERNGHIRHNVTPPVDDETFVAVADILLSGKTLAESSLCGTDKPLPGGKRGREMLTELRTWMIEWKILTWNKKNGEGEPLPKQGVSLTKRGAQWLQEALPPHPGEVERPIG